MRKLYFKLVVLSLFILLIGSTSAFATGSEFSTKAQQKLGNTIILYLGRTNAYINNVKIAVDATNESVSPFVKDGRTLVPVRFISENLGAKVDWEQATETVIVNLNKRMVKMKIGSSVVDIDGADKYIDVPAQIVNGRAFIPLRALVEALGKKVFWDDRGLIIISDVDNILKPIADKDIIKEVVDKFNERGNTVGNIVNGGYFAEQGDWIYYWNKGDINKPYLYKEKSDGTQKTLLSQDFASSINIVDDWVYYRNGDVNSIEGGLYRIKTDGTNKSLITEDIASYINIIGDWIYYSNLEGLESSKLYKIKTDGTQRTKISDDNADFINVVGDWIYYRNQADGYSLYKIKTDGSSRVKVIGDNLSSLYVDGSWIYFTDGKLYKVKTDGAGKTKLAESANDMNIEGEWIYFINHYTEGKNIFKIKKDGTGKVRLNDEKSWGISIIGEWIYYFNEKGLVSKIKTNAVSPTSTKELKFISSEPASGSIFDGSKQNILVKFSNNIEGVDPKKIIIKNAITGVNLDTISWAFEKGQIVVRSSGVQSLKPQTPITVTILKGAVTDQDGNTTKQDIVLNFTTPAAVDYNKLTYTDFDDKHVTFKYPSFYTIATAPEGTYYDLNKNQFLSKWGFFSKEIVPYNKIQFEIRYDNHIEYGDNRKPQVITIDDVMNGLNESDQFASVTKVKKNNGIVFATEDSYFIRRYIYGNPIGDVIPKLSISISKGSADKASLEKFNSLADYMINSFSVVK